VDPQCGDVAQCGADQNCDQRVFADVLRNRSGRTTARIDNVLCRSTRLRPYVPRRFACLVQHPSRLSGHHCGGPVASSTIFWTWSAAAAVAAVALCTRSPIAFPASVTRDPKFLTFSEGVSSIVLLRLTSVCRANDHRKNLLLLFRGCTRLESSLLGQLVLDIAGSVLKIAGSEFLIVITARRVFQPPLIRIDHVAAVLCAVTFL
jgi:hypothetical protein